MAVLKKSGYVILLFFIAQFPRRSYGGETEDEINESQDTLRRLQDWATGYQAAAKRSFEFNDSNNWSVVDLRNKIADLSGRLECGYYYSAQLYMKLTREAVFENVGAEKKYPVDTVAALSFAEEAATMIDSLFDAKRGRTNELWILLMYAWQTRSQIEFLNTIEDNDALVARVYEQNERLNDFALSAIEKRIKDGRCDPENSFNMNDRACEHWPFSRSNPSRDESCSSSRKAPRRPPNVANYDDKINALRANKDLLLKNFRDNRIDGPSRYSDSGSFSVGYLLLFPDGNAFEYFIREFLTSNPNGVRFPKLESIWRWRYTRSIGEYLLHVTGILQIIMLQITLSYTNRLAVESGHISADTVKFSNEVLTKFRLVMHLKYDESFNEIYNGFSQCKNDVHECTSFLNKAIYRLIGIIESASGIRPIKSIVDIDEKDKTNGLSDLTLDESLKVGVTLVEKIQNQIGEKPIRLAQSFLITWFHGHNDFLMACSKHL